jgi:hypothetical protein
MLKIGVVGTLEKGAEINEIISDQTACALTGIFDPDPDLSLQFSGSSNLPFFTSYKAFLSRCDAIIVDRVKSLRSEHIVEAIRDSKHVLLEKPIDWSENELEYLYKLADEANTLLKLRESFLFHPVITAARPLIQNPAFIDYQIDISADTNSDRLQDLITSSIFKCLDSIFYLNPARITKSNTVLSPDLFGFPGVIHGSLEFDNGCISNITCNGYSEQEKFTCNIYQENRQSILNFITNRLIIKDKMPGDDKPRSTKIPVGKTNQVADEIMYFIELVINKNYHLVPFHNYFQSFVLGKQMLQNLPVHSLNV